MDGSFVEALELDGARAVHSLANGSGRLPRFFARKFLITQGRDFDLNVDPVQQRARNFGSIALDLERGASALFLRIGKKSTGTSLRYLSAMWC